MVELRTFRALGYALAVLGIVGSAFNAINGLTVSIGGGDTNSSQHQIGHEESKTNGNYVQQKATGQIIGGILGIILYSAFIIGIKRANSLIVNIFRILVIISNVLVLVGLGIGAIVLIFIGASADSTSGDAQGVTTLAVVMVIIFTLFWLAKFMVELWIINGVKQYVEWKRTTVNQGKC